MAGTRSTSPCTGSEIIGLQVRSPPGANQVPEINRFLVEFLIAHFGDPQIGATEPFLSSFEFKDREKAERLANWIKERITVPTSRDRTEVEVLELSQGGFKVRAAWIGDGDMHEIIR
jgi:hypothetical protein